MDCRQKTVKEKRDLATHKNDNLTMTLLIVLWKSYENLNSFNRRVKHNCESHISPTGAKRIQ